MFKSEEAAFLIPTKDRPEKLRTLLQSIADQGIAPGQLLIIASGTDVGNVAKEFNQLNIDYHHVDFSGQIRQRNFGLTQLKPNIRLVFCMDDDMVMRPGSIQAILHFWNRNPQYTAVCFNIIGEKPFRFNLFKFLFCMTGTKPGHVTKAGYNTRITSVEKDIETEWVMGGFTTWQKEVLQKHPYKNSETVYPFNEDLYYSYPLCREEAYKYAVCQAAQVEHRHEQAGRRNKRFGEIQVHARFKLVRDTPEYFSMPLAYWASLGQCLENLVRGYFKVAFGNLVGMWRELQKGYSVFSKSLQ